MSLSTQALHSRSTLKMTLSASLLLLLLLGLSRAVPLQEDVEREGDPGLVEIGARILNINNHTDEFLMEGDLVAPKTRNAIKCWNGNRDCLWPKGRDGLVTIPYTLSSQFDWSNTKTIKDGLTSFHGVSCIRFVPRGNQRDYLKIESKSGCFSNLGRTGGGQVLSLSRSGCVYRGIVQHEALHALGFRHEHNRSDRDRYVKINWNNILQNMAYNFKKGDTNNLGVPYDYSSIMHYGKTAFAINQRSQTIIPIPNSNVQIGQRQTLSDNDILKLNKLYGCEEKEKTC